MMEKITFSVERVIIPTNKCNGIYLDILIDQCGVIIKNFEIFGLDRTEKTYKIIPPNSWNPETGEDVMCISFSSAKTLLECYSAINRFIEANPILLDLISNGLIF